MFVYGHVPGHVRLGLVRDHVVDHVPPSQDHVPSSQDHVGESSPSLFGYSLVLGADWVDLGVSRSILS